LPKLSINVEEIISRYHDNFEEQNDMEPSTMIINYVIVIIIVVNAHFNYIV
jgi:hypothetical protein